MASNLLQKLNQKVKDKHHPALYKGPDKKSANGNRPLTFPTPYHGGKRRWAEEILAAFGEEREAVYVEPFSGSAAVLLANDRPYAREIICDTNPHIINVFRSLAWAPEVTAFWADWPTLHQDLTARHTWLLRWAVENAAEIESNPDFHDPKAAGWWLWGKSNWIGSEFAIVRGLQTGGEPDMADATRISTSRPHTGIGHGFGTGMGVQVGREKLPVHGQRTSMPSVKDTSGVNAQRVNLPTDKRPSIPAGGFQGVSAQVKKIPVAPDGIPHVGIGVGGPTAQGVQAQRTTLPTAPDKRPQVGRSAHGQGVSALRKDDTLPQSSSDVRIDNSRPAVTDGMRGNGVSVQRRAPLPQSSSDIPYAPEHGGGRGVNAQRKQAYPDSGGKDATLPTPPDKRPAIPGHGPIGIQAHSRELDKISQYDKRPEIPAVGNPGGVSAQRHDMPETPPDKRPHIKLGGGVGGGNGVSAQRQPQDAAPLPPYDGRAYRPYEVPEKMPHVGDGMGGVGITAQRGGIEQADDPPDAGHGARAAIGKARKEAQQIPVYERNLPVPLTGDRLKPWFLAIAERLYRVIILNRGWQSGLTPTVLQQTRNARKPPVRVLIDPPYKGVGKLYGMAEEEADALAIASWRWAVENADRPDWRIAYCCREGDFDEEALALGWTSNKANIPANKSDDIKEVVWYSPQCWR